MSRDCGWLPNADCALDKNVSNARNAIDCGRRLVAIDPAAVEFRSVLATALELQGDIAIAQSNRPAATESYEQATHEWTTLQKNTTDWPQPAAAIALLRLKLAM